MKFNSIVDSEDKKKTIWIKEDQSINGVFRGDIHEFKVHWVNKQKITCRGTDCTYCIGDKPRFQFRVNFVHKDVDGSLIASLYENDWFTYKRMSELNKSTPLENALVKIYKGTHNGYKIDLFEKVKEMDEATLKIIEGIQLLDLSDSIADYSEPKSSEDIPF